MVSEQWIGLNVNHSNKNCSLGSMISVSEHSQYQKSDDRFGVKNEFNVMCNPFGNEKNRDPEQKYENNNIWSHSNHRNPILWGHFLLTVKLLLLFMLFMIWCCFCRLCMWATAIILRLIQFAFDCRQRQKCLEQHSIEPVIPSVWIIAIALCALCDFRRMLRFKFVQKEHSNRSDEHRMIKYR